MKNKSFRCFFFIVFLALLSTNAYAQSKFLSSKPIIVGTKQAPPFAIKNSDGSWSGISIDLWKEIANRQQIVFQIKEYDLEGLINAAKNGDVDVAVAALTITPEREKNMDFSYPFYSEGLGIAVPKKNENNWLALLKSFVSAKFLSVIAVLALTLLFFGFLAWIFERKYNSEEFRKSPGTGLLDGFWWSAVTMTTVGYGDKSPKSLGGRIIALIWMFTSVIIISSFTAAIASSITVNKLEGNINGPDDLAKVNVGTVSNSASEQVLIEMNIPFTEYDTLQNALQSLDKGSVGAVVYDAPLLQYLVNKKFERSLRVLSNTFTKQPYGMALPTNHPLRETINQSMLEIINSTQWPQIINLYLGSH